MTSFVYSSSCFINFYDLKVFKIYKVRLKSLPRFETRPFLQGRHLSARLFAVGDRHLGKTRCLTAMQSINRIELDGNVLGTGIISKVYLFETYCPESIK